MYVTDNFTRYCVHMVQLNGKRQIILSTYSKDILEEWLIVLKESVDMKNSLVFGESESGSSEVVEAPPVILPSSEESEKSFTLDRSRFFPEEVSDQFIATVNEKKAYRMYLDASGTGIKLQMGSNNPQPNAQKNASTDINPKSKQISQQTSILPGFEEHRAPQNSPIDFPPGLGASEQIAPPSPYEIRSAPKAAENMDFSSVQKHDNRGGTSHDQGSGYQLPQAVIAFQSKFNLPPSERPIQCE